jgi:hypothetical protein
MSNKNRLQRRGMNVVMDDTLGGAISELAGAVGHRTSATGTRQLEYMYTRTLTGISMSRFKWYGLPSTVSRRWLETCLLTQSLAVFFKDAGTGQFFATQGTPTGNYNMVGDPTEFHAVSANSYRWWDLDLSECVPIWANELRTPDLDIIQNYAHVLAETDRTIQINLKNARQPKVAAFSEAQGLTVANIIRQVEEGSNFIGLEADFGAELEKVFQVLDLGIHPDLLLNTSIMRTRIFGEAMTMLGINNAPNQDKKERVVAAEVSGNDDVVEMIRRKNLEGRQTACEEINLLFPEIAQLPENQPEQYEESDPQRAAVLRAHPGVWVEYATDMNQTALKDSGQEKIAGPNGQGDD